MNTLLSEKYDFVYVWPTNRWLHPESDCVIDDEEMPWELKPEPKETYDPYGRVYLTRNEVRHRLGLPEVNFHDR